MSRTLVEKKHKDQTALAAAVLCAIAGVLIWTLWVLPISRSVGEADPSSIGETVTLDLDAGERAGIWGSGRVIAFGTADCAVRGPDGAEVPQRGEPSLNWDDTLWWLNQRPGFSQFSQFEASDAGAYRVRCIDTLDTYDGEFLVAGDSFGSGSIGLGRSGSSDFAVGTVLAFCAVVCPLVAVLLTVIIPLRRLSDRVRRRRLSRSSF